MSDARHRSGPTPELTDFSWALLVSLHLYMKDNPCSEMQQHMHILRWLGNAKKRHIFPKSLAAEIDWFISEGRRKGTRAGLRAKAEYIWFTSTGETRQQSDLRRLSFFFDAVKKMGWEDQLVSDAEWHNTSAVATAVPTLSLQKSELHDAFDASENMVHSLTLRLSQPWPGLALVAQDCFFVAEPAPDESGHCQYVLKKCPD